MLKQPFLRIHLKSLLNRIEPLKVFVYKEQRFFESIGVQPFLEMDTELGINDRPVCSGCGKKGPAYDRLAATELALFHAMRNLRESKFTDSFCCGSLCIDISALTAIAGLCLAVWLTSLHR